jgi:V/A-type H+-transporting ATPase subunit B
MQPSELISTGIAGIDLNNTLVTGTENPFFADPDQPFNQLWQPWLCELRLIK